MKNLELTGYGLEEMNHDEMVATDGGILPLIIAAVVLIGLCSCNNGNGNQVQVGGRGNLQTTSADSSRASIDSNNVHMNVNVPLK